MFCPYCGKEISDGITTCTECGRELPTIRPELKDALEQGYYVNENRGNEVPQPTAPQPQQADVWEQPGAAQPQQQAAWQQPADQPQPAPAPQQTYHQDPFGSSYTPPATPVEEVPFPQSIFVSPPQDVYAQAEAQGLQLKWFKWIIWVSCYLSVFAAFAAIPYITGAIYGDSADRIYLYYPALRAVNILYGLALIALVVFNLYMRGRMAQFKADAPKLYFISLAASAAISVVYALLTGVIIGDVVIQMGSAITVVISSGIMIALCNTYFTKRASLFTR